MQESLMGILHKNHWISNATRVSALAKVEGMRKYVGYPDWLANNVTGIELEFSAVSAAS